jgi:hypothetical protein
MAEVLRIPTKVVDSDWKDDINYELYGTNKQEMEYIAPENVSKESIERIKARKLNKERGNKLLSLFTKSEKFIA